MQHSKSARVPSCRTNPYRNVRFGSLADKPSRAKIQLCLLWSKSGHTPPRLGCPLYAKSCHRAVVQKNGRGRQLRRPINGNLFVRLAVMSLDTAVHKHRPSHPGGANPPHCTTRALTGAVFLTKKKPRDLAGAFTNG